jgi:ABC-2 type transport system permease protein
MDGYALRAVVASGLYLALLAVFSLGLGTILRHTAGAITLVLALLLGPVIAISFLPESVAEWFEKFSLMGAGIAGQQTVVRDDAIPLGPWEGLGVVAAYAAAALVVALYVIRMRCTSSACATRNADLRQRYILGILLSMFIDRSRS